MTIKKLLSDNRNLILTMELAGLLHDAGKLDSKFIEYRKTWQKRRGEKDPHEANFFDRLESEYKALSDALERKFSEFETSHLGGIDPSPTIKEVMHHHTKPEELKSDLAGFLWLGDALDTAYDRNNPLLAMEQFGPVTFRSNVFGYETRLDINNFDKEREDLFDVLNNKLPPYLRGFDHDTRHCIFDSTEKAFRIAVTDTCRPANDIPLWQHSYATAALTKVFFNHYLIYREKLFGNDLKKKKSIKDARFALIGFAWDGLAFISKGHKIGDNVGRKKIIHDLKEWIKCLYEFEYPLGMNIYDDDNGIYFIVPAILDNGKGREYKEFLKGLKEEAFNLSNEMSCGEILPSYGAVENTHIIMDIVHARKKASDDIGFPQVKPAWINLWSNQTATTICPVCQKRPIPKVDGKEYEICKECNERRKSARELRKKKESIFTDEIAEGNGRLALIVARFELESWLSGDMIWSLFVKEPNSLKKAVEHLGRIVDYETGDKKRLDLIGPVQTFDYNKIRAFAEIIEQKINSGNKNDDFATAISFLFDRHGGTLKDPEKEEWDQKREWVKRINKAMEIGDPNRGYGQEADFYNFLCAKNHTPSRLLNVWNYTRDFFGGLFYDENFPKDNDLPPFRRIILELGEQIRLEENTPYEAKVEGKAIEIFREEGTVYLINEGCRDIAEQEYKVWEGKEIIIIKEEGKKKEEKRDVIKIKSISKGKEEISPFRVITATPDIFMALVPADRALKVTDYLYRKYKEHLGKVIGRLPISVGHIFFQKRTPMFIVLDSARRMLRNFENLYENWRKGKETLEVTDFDEGRNVVTFSNGVRWDGINYNNGDLQTDYFHPYFIVDQSCGDAHKSAPSYFKTFMGDLVYVSDIKKAYQLKVLPNFYDFEFLDSNARRFDIYLENKKRKSGVANFYSRPIYLEELFQKAGHLWGDLLKGRALKGITDTKLNKIKTLWLTTYEEWTNNGKADKKTWEDFVELSIRREFPDVPEERYKLLKETIQSGLFFDTLELYNQILKERIEA
jgi:CRISPR-associated Csx11 family protein